MEYDVRIKFFQLDRCGYYRYRSSHAAFGSLSEALDDLLIWVQDKSISETTTYEPSFEQDENLLHTYCYSIKKNTHEDVLLTTWNETASSDGAIASLNLTGPVESADVETSEIPTGYVPGYPAYFWFPHEVGGFATIQINNRLNGRNNLDEFIRGFLRNHSKWVVIGDQDEETGDEILLGYSQTGLVENLDSARPYFKATQWRKNGNLDFIRNNRSEIRKMVRKDELNFTHGENLALWQRIWRNITGGDTTPLLNGTHRLSLEVDYTPEENDLETIIHHWEESQHNVVGQYQDVGFKLHGDQKTHWLSQSLASEVFVLDLVYSDGPLVDAELLLSQLHGKRSQILALLEESNNGD